MRIMPRGREHTQANRIKAVNARLRARLRAGHRTREPGRARSAPASAEREPHSSERSL